MDGWPATRVAVALWSIALNPSLLQKGKVTVDSTLPLGEQLNDKVCPLWRCGTVVAMAMGCPAMWMGWQWPAAPPHRLPYEEQLALKQQKLVDLLVAARAGLKEWANELAWLAGYVATGVGQA
jgi:hypothetical protein